MTPEAFRKLPPGLHVVYETKVLPGDTKPIRTGRTFVLAAHSSWTAQMQGEVKQGLTRMLLDPQSTPDLLNEYVVFLGTEMSRPAPIRKL